MADLSAPRSIEPVRVIETALTVETLNKAPSPALFKYKPYSLGSLDFNHYKVYQGVEPKNRDLLPAIIEQIIQ
jgi:hypothetical protein